MFEFGMVQFSNGWDYSCTSVKETPFISKKTIRDLKDRRVSIHLNTGNENEEVQYSDSHYSEILT